MLFAYAFDDEPVQIIDLTVEKMPIRVIEALKNPQILKTAFNRGKICWHRNYGHIVWMDDDGLAYDIYGPFYDYNEGDLLPIEDSLGDLIVDFMHNGKEYKCGSTVMKDWIDSHYFKSDAEAIAIYQKIPKEEINDNNSYIDLKSIL